MSYVSGLGAVPRARFLLRALHTAIRLAFIRSKRVIAGAEGRDVACGAPNCTWRVVTGGSEEFIASVPLAFLYPELNQT